MKTNFLIMLKIISFALFALLNLSSNAAHAKDVLLKSFPPEFRGDWKLANSNKEEFFWEVIIEKNGYGGIDGFCMGPIKSIKQNKQGDVNRITVIYKSTNMDCELIGGYDTTIFELRKNKLFTSMGADKGKLFGPLKKR
jgi:hypothetical protein